MGCRVWHIQASSTAFLNLRRRIITDRLDSTTIETRRQSLWASFTAFMVVVAMASNLVGCIFNQTYETDFSLGGASYETGFCPHGGKLSIQKL